MSYDLYDDKGYCGPGPSICGWTNLKKALNAKKVNSAQFPQIASMFRNGYASSPTRLKLEAMSLAKVVPDADNKKTLLAISKVAAKAQSVVILHDHMGKQ